MMVLIKAIFMAFVFSRLLPDVRALATTTAPSSASDIVPRAFIHLVNPLDTAAAAQKLPASMVAHWPTWVLDTDGTMLPIPDSDGFVPPTSIDELWQPVDLQSPQMRLAVGLHVRKGQIRHVLPALDLTLSNGAHRNRGLCSVPRAYAWVDFTTSLDEWKQYRLSVASRKQNDDNDDWTEVAASTGTQIADALERALLCLAQTPPDALGEGSHIVHVLLNNDNDKDNDNVVVECPTTGSELRVTLEQTLGDSAPGILQVAISASMAGSESEFLPAAYQPLFQDATLRREAYADYKERLLNNNPNL